MVTDRNDTSYLARQLAFGGWLPEGDPDDLTSDDWYTPLELVDEIRRFFGGDIDLDPCAARRGFVGARVSYFVDDNGLEKPWLGPVDGIPIRTRFINPPHSTPGPWIRAAATLHERDDVGDTIALIKCDPSTRAWRYVWLADAVLFFDKRIPFARPGSSTRSVAPFPSALVYWGPHSEGFEAWWSWLGHVVRPLVSAETIVQQLVDDGIVKFTPDGRVTTREHERTGGHKLISIDKVPAETYPFLPTYSDIGGNGRETDRVVDPNADTAVIECVDEQVHAAWLSADSDCAVAKCGARSTSLSIDPRRITCATCKGAT